MEDGFITGSGFDVNPKSLGYSTCTYVGLNLERGNMYKKVVERLQNIPEIVECHFTTGSYTMLIKLYARDNEQLMDLLNNKLQTILAGNKLMSNTQFENGNWYLLTWVYDGPNIFFYVNGTLDTSGAATKSLHT